MAAEGQKVWQSDGVMSRWSCLRQLIVILSVLQTRSQASVQKLASVPAARARKLLLFTGDDYVT